MDNESRLKEVFGWPDAVLAVGGLLGLVLVLFAAPSEHPHSTASDYLPQAQAVDSARAFALRSGALQLADAEAEASIRYDGALLNELQRRLGHDEAMSLLSEDDVPAYAWDVSWTSTSDEENESLGWTRVTLDGRFLGMHVEPSAIPRQAYHTEALSQLVESAPVPVDSLPPNRLSFRLDAPARQEPLRIEDFQSDRVFLNRSDAEALALYHLQQGPFAGVPVHVDSVFASGSDGLLTATVRVSADDEAPGRFFRADIEVMPTGTLVHLDPSFVPADDSAPADDSEADGFDAEDARGIATFVAYILLGLLMVVIFFRRLSARVVDTKTAIRDGLIAAAAAAIAISTQLTSDFEATEVMDAVGILLGMLLIGFTGGILVFFISGAALSMARERWDEKLQTLALVRSSYVRNVPVGTALLRGIMAGLTLSGIASLVLVLFDDAWLHFESSGVAYFGSLLPGVAALRDVGGNLFWAMVLTLGAVIGVGALFHRKKGRWLWYFVSVILTLVVLQMVPFDLRPLPALYGMAAVYAALAAVIFWRFDALTTLVTLFIFILTASYIPYWSVPTAPEFVDALATMIVVAAIAVTGVAGVMSRKRSSEVPVMVPDYIRELAQQERVKRELELAREVQLSFLPARTPEVLGLDLASVCLPAYEVGGDYYDFFRMSGDRLGVVVGDVSGKGMQAAFYMTLMKGILQSLNTSLSRPSDILIGANELFRMNAPRGMFMSIVLGVIDLKNRTWTCARAGHNPMLILRAGAERPEEIKPRGAAIGLASDPTFSLNIEEMTVTLSAGDLLLIYTDGITEAMNRDRVLFDEDRLDDSIAKARGRSAADVLASIVDDVEQFTGDAPRHDDMTMVAIRILDYDRD